MNLNAIANAATRSITPNVIGLVQHCTGYTVDPTGDGSQIPVYDTATDVQLQVQALSNKDVRQLDALNIQNVFKAVYVNQKVDGVDRTTGQGGDLLIFDGFTWLVVIVLEEWTGPGWTKVGVAKQLDPTP